MQWYFSRIFEYYISGLIILGIFESTDLILFVIANAADFHVGELGDEVDVLLAVFVAVEALVGARLGVQHRLDQAGVRADLQRGEKEIKRNMVVGL